MMLRWMIVAAVIVVTLPGVSVAQAAQQQPVPPRQQPGYSAPRTGFFSRLMELERRKNERIRQFFSGGRR